MSDLDILRARVPALRVYELGEVPASPTYPYAVTSLSSPSDLGRALDGSTWTDRRFVVQMHGRTHDAVESVAKQFDEAFKDQVIAEFPGQPFCWREIAAGPYRDPDAAGVVSATHTYRL